MKEENNISKKDNKPEFEESKVWLGEDGIVRLRIGDIRGEKTIEQIAEDTIEIVKKLPSEAKILIDLGVASRIPPIYRKDSVRIARDAIKKIRFEKVALYGGIGSEGVIQRVVASFIISVFRLKNIKTFKTEKKALKWLK